MTEEREPLYTVKSIKLSRLGNKHTVQHSFMEFEDAVSKYEDCKNIGIEGNKAVATKLILNLPDFDIDITYIYQAGVTKGVNKND